MGFWIFLLIMNMLIPLTMTGFGYRFMKKPPKNINMVYGYRTSMSMKNEETWKFAHEFFGRLWFRFGVVLLILNIIIMILMLGYNSKLLGIFGTVLCYLQIIGMFFPILPTELALRKRFDKDGKRKEFDNFT